MANVSSVVNHWITAQEGFTTTTSGSVSSGAATVGLNSVAGYTNGDIIALVIDPTNSSKQVFTGVVDTSGVQITGVKWTEGTNVTHLAGATVVDYETATAWAAYAKGLKVQHNQDGTHGAITATSATINGNATITGTLTVGGQGSGGYDPISGTVSAVTYNGNRSYSLTMSADNTANISRGMRLRTTRIVAAPTQCTDLESTSSQYYSKSSPNAMTFTDDFVVSAWVKLESYTGASQGIASRYNGTSGWIFFVNSNGQIAMQANNAGAGNSSTVQSYQSIPLGRWVHVTAQLDMSAFTATTTTSYIMIDGVDVPASVSRAGTNPTALIQAGNLEVGSFNAGAFFDGKIAQVAIYNAKVTQANVRATISQTLAGNETSLISAYSFNNTFNDLSANANNLTANGSAVATNADSPFGGQDSGTISSTLDYGIVQTISAGTAVVQVAEGCTFATTGGLSAVSYSRDRSPYGFPAERGKWRITSLLRVDSATTSNATFGPFLGGGWALLAPIGAWDFGWIAGIFSNVTTTMAFNVSKTALTGLSIAAGYSASPYQMLWVNNAANTMIVSGLTARGPENLSAATTFTMYTFGATTSASIVASNTTCEIYAENAYL